MLWPVRKVRISAFKWSHCTSVEQAKINLVDGCHADATYCNSVNDAPLYFATSLCPFTLGAYSYFATSLCPFTLGAYSYFATSLCPFTLGAYSSLEVVSTAVSSNDAVHVTKKYFIPALNAHKHTPTEVSRAFPPWIRVNSGIISQIRPQPPLDDGGVVVRVPGGARIFLSLYRPNTASYPMGIGRLFPRR
jgi:hypothetical protein